MKSTVTPFLSAIFLFMVMSINAQETIIAKGELPKPAQDFISHNFSQNTLEFIIMDKEILSTDYKVKFADGAEIEFDSNGDWTEIDGNKTAIPTGFIQKNILSYVKEKFPNTQIVQIEKGRFGKQEVKLSNGLELEFNSNGTFKKID